MRVLLVLAITLVAVAQQPQPCTSPPQWQAFRHSYNLTTGEMMAGEYFEDQINLRKAYQFQFQEGVDQVPVWTIQLWNKANPSGPGQQYVIYPQNKTCMASLTNSGWHGHGIPANAFFVSEEFYGTSSAWEGGVNCYTWEFINAGGNHLVTYTMAACLPIHSIQWVSGTNEAAEADWFNCQIGISNPNVFIPPPYC